MAGRFTSSRGVARQASLVVKFRVMNQGLVWIVTCDARQASISLRSPAAAFLQAIGLEAHVDRPVGLGGLYHVHRGSVASSTEVHGFHGAEMCGIEYGLQRLLALIGVDRIDVLYARPVTLLTMDSRHGAGNVELRTRR